MIHFRSGLRGLVVLSYLLLRLAGQQVSRGGSSRECEYHQRWALARATHRAIDAFLARGLCRLDAGALCRTGRDGRPFLEGRAAFRGSDGEWAVSGHSGESTSHTRFLFDAAFLHSPKRICEVGFNVGHSAASLLIAAGGNASYLGFDLPRLNPGANQEFFEMLKLWLGPEHRLEMMWGDASLSIQSYLDRSQAVSACDLLFYDGAHDVLSVLRVLPQLRRLAAPSRAIIIIDDVRCNGPLCGHSALAWDFLVWAGLIEEVHCQSSRSAHAALEGDDFGACLGRFKWGAQAANCPRFDARCVAGTYVDGDSRSDRDEEWSKCCL